MIAFFLGHEHESVCRVCTTYSLTRSLTHSALSKDIRKHRGGRGLAAGVVDAAAGAGLAPSHFSHRFHHR